MAAQAPASFTPCWRSKRCRVSTRRSPSWWTCTTRWSSARCPLGQQRHQGRYFPSLAARTVGAYALSEAGSGSDAFALAMRATDTADGFVLNGRKLWITNGAEAGVFIVFATLNPDAGYRGITAFIIERDTPGFTVGRKEDKLGIRASSTCELLLDRLSGVARERARRRRQGLQGRHRDAQRRTDRHRRTDGRSRAGSARPCDCTT